MTTTIMNATHSPRDRRASLVQLAIAALTLLAACAPAAAAPERAPDAHSSAAFAPAALPVETRRILFSRLANQPALRLRTTEGRATLDFGARGDELVTKAALKLRYTYSPALIPGQSHLKVLLNGEMVGVLPMPRENAGRMLTHELDIDPRLITGFNKLALEFVGHYASDCENPLHSSLWADISGGSELLLTVRPVPLHSDLALLPEPFFDKRDLSRLMLPVVFAAKPSHATLRAAGIASSWFGKLAGWRGARFPTQLDALPKGHALVFATNTERPAFLAQAAPFAGPALSVVTSPADGFSKLLLVTGRDGEDLRVAATALALGNAALSGEQMAITQSREEAPRNAYDAPNWVRLDRPMKFGELVESPQQLQVSGHLPEPVRVNVRIPPDLFTWRSRGVPVNLKFRYTPPVRTADSDLAMSINGERVQSVNLRASGQGGDSTRVVLPLLGSDLLDDGRELLIPAFRLGARNEVQYQFRFSHLAAGPCRDTQVDNVRAMIDPDSTIDFSGYPHYADMPHLGYFAASGFPFTRFADLSQTAVVMPHAPTAQDIEMLLALLARFGESTGYPATRVSVAGPDDAAALRGKDLLLIGAVGRQPLLERWSRALPAIIAGAGRTIRTVPGTLDRLRALFGFGSEAPRASAPGAHLRGDGPLAAMLGFRSPVDASRSAVALTAMDAQQMLPLLDLLQDERIAASMHGSVFLAHGGETESIVAGERYTLGELPFWTAIWFPLSAHPVLLAAMAVIAVLIFAFALWRTLRAVARRRLEGSEG